MKRGKVAFLFNKYSEAYIVNILIYCHDYMNNAVTQMWITLDEWIKEYVGATPEKRARNIARLQGSPFFVVATKFNTDMARMTNDALNDKAMLRKRWDDRFMKILYSECFQAKPDMWFHNWEAPGATFKNTYLLRDYKYSSETGNGNHLYSGFTDTNKSEVRCLLKEHIVQDEGRDIDFYSLLRQSFVENENVRKFFADPAKSWDVAATINNDGSLYLVEQLSIVARRMGEGRVALFTEKLNEVKRAVRGALQEFYHDLTPRSALRRTCARPTAWPASSTSPATTTTTTSATSSRPSRLRRKRCTARCTASSAAANSRRRCTTTTTTKS